MITEMERLDHIEEAIDDVLGGTRGWSKKEFDFYKLLVDKVREYGPRIQSYKFNSEDKEALIDNFKRQPWLEKSKHQSRLLKMIREIDIVDYQFNSDSKENKLCIRINFDKGFSYNLYFHRTRRSLQYHIYFQNEAENERGYICYLDTTTESGNELKLPEYRKIKGIISSRGLDNYDIIHLSAEIMSYYDSSGEMSSANIGKKYPVTLVYLSTIATVD